MVETTARREFTWPAGIAVSADGNVFCSDEHDNFVAAFPPDGPFTPYPDFNPDGEHMFKWGEPGADSGQLNGPSGLAFDQSDDLLVVDSRNDRVQKFTKEGRYLAGWGSTRRQRGRAGTDRGASAWTGTGTSTWPTGGIIGCRSSLRRASSS